MENRNSYKVIGLMSGTSLDGLDIVYCTFTKAEEKWSFKITEGETIPYSNAWLEKLSKAFDCSGRELIRTHFEYGTYLGEQVNEFCKKHSLKPDFISSHGHTIFHKPSEGYTFQIGHGAAISAKAGIKTISDFRSLDVALGGQGAPLVPIGDELLFGQYTHCLNLGGFANISFQENNKRVAFDICPVNILLNPLANKKGVPYDNEGKIARAGNLDSELLNKLNNLSFYSENHPKSLGKEWSDENISPLLNSSGLSIEDKLCTVVEHIAIQIGRHCNYGAYKLLITGGGAYNSFLIERLKEYTKAIIQIPDGNTIEFKEALIFAFLGVLRIEEEINCLSSVTGARKNSIEGSVYL